MLYIDPNSNLVKELSKAHFRSVRCIIRKRIGSILKCAEQCSICESSNRKRKGVPSTWILILEDEDKLRRLILANPSDLEGRNEEIFSSIFPKKTTVDILKILKDKKKYENDQKKGVANRIGIPDVTEDEKEFLQQFKLLSKIIDYTDWFNKLDAHQQFGPYFIAEKLNMRSCTYCNRQYTLTVKSSSKSGKLTRPQFDHWLSKDHFPLLGLSFYNLIPSCPTCNSSVKGNIKFNTNEFIHPYLDDVIDEIQFSFEYFGTLDKWKIRVNSHASNNDTQDRIKTTLDALKIEEVYNAHHPELDDLLKIAQAYSRNYLKTLKRTFPEAGLTDEQIYRLAFGTELDPKNFHKRPMSKFKHDILKKLGIID